MSSFAGGYGSEAAASTISVGKALGSRSGYGHNHAAYQRVAQLVTTEVARVAERDSEKRSKATPVVMPLVLDSGLVEYIGGLFPEFRMLNYGQDRPGHLTMSALQIMSNELILDQACRIAGSVVHLGGSLMSAMLKRDVDIHLEIDSSSPSAVHARMSSVRCVARVMGDYAAFTADAGMNHARANYERYLRRQAYNTCTRSSSCGVRAEAFCVDLSTNAMSPAQFCASMRQCEASVGYGFFIYHPIMLVSTSGEIPGTGVMFEKTDTAIHFKYPEGIAGTESYTLSEWAAWLCEHTISVGKGLKRTVYQIQLSKARGPFMFFSATKVDGEPAATPLRHALDLPMSEKHYVVSSWTLKDLVSDPSEATSWQPVTFMVPTKVVDSLVGFGMQLAPDAFSRYALRKQLKVLDRVTMEGSTITKGFTLSRSQADLLITAVHADLFAKRYESGQLTKHMMDGLKAISGFKGATTRERALAVGSWHLFQVWDTATQQVNGLFDKMCEWLERCFPNQAVDHMPRFSLAPEYVSFETVSTAWLQHRPATYAQAVRDLSNFQVSRGSVSLRGGPLAMAIASIQKVSSESLLASARIASNAMSGMTSTFTKHVVQNDSDDVVQIVEGVSNDEIIRIMSEIRMLNGFDQAPVDRHVYPTESVVRTDAQTDLMASDLELDVDYVGTMNRVYEAFNPGVPAAAIERDIASISQDDQIRTLAADKLRLPRLMDMYPRDREYYLSRVLAINAPKRQETQQELLSAVAARNLAAPRIALPQDNEVLIPEIWDKFLDTMCVEGARDKLENYKLDPVALEEQAYVDWLSKAKPNTIQMVRRELEQQSQTLEEMNVGDYLIMLKADVKPPLSDKPLRSRIEPQVIVYHQKVLSSLYSSIFRVLVRRFLSLLRPEVHVNLLKDSRDISAFIRSNHPFGSKLRYLENDFSKYDKSQDEFVFSLEAYVFNQLGMNHAMLSRWLEGHVDCSLRSLTTGLSASVRFQRKSGDATTAFGNVILNILSVSYAYSPSSIKWAVFMGDDSIVACGAVGKEDRAVAMLAEIFNLTAKMYITDHPYFASNFIVIDDYNGHVELVPDPIKWIEKRSQPVSADDPQWKERYISAAESAKPYRHRINTIPLGEAVAARYGMSKALADELPSAIATAVSTEAFYRQCYHDEPEFIRY
ncbi:RNA-dependent RNA polymerase [Erysiphe necator associated virga-like virus 13]|nr:RNA-dependent RNA polymerase [Erysiphe necator associated virga-like virus 13]